MRWQKGRKRERIDRAQISVLQPYPATLLQPNESVHRRGVVASPELPPVLPFSDEGFTQIWDIVNADDHLAFKRTGQLGHAGELIQAEVDAIACDVHANILFPLSTIAGRAAARGLPEKRSFASCCRGPRESVFALWSSVPGMRLGSAPARAVHCG